MLVASSVYCDSILTNANARRRQPDDNDVQGIEHSRVGSDTPSWAFSFLVIAVIAGLLAFTGIVGTAAGIARILLFVFLVVFRDTAGDGPTPTAGTIGAVSV